MRVWYLTSSSVVDGDKVILDKDSDSMPLAMWQGLQLCGGAYVCFYGVPDIGIVPLDSNSFYKRHMLTSLNTVLYVS